MHALDTARGTTAVTATAPSQQAASAAADQPPGEATCTAGRKGPFGPGNLLVMTGLGAADGTIILLAAQGVLSTLAGAIATGLTVVGGVGAWLVAREVYASRRLTGRDAAVLAAVALATSLATAAAAWLGDWVSGTLTLHVLPRAAGLVLLLIAVEVGGIRLPRIARVPLPAFIIAAGFILEGVAQWTP